MKSFNLKNLQTTLYQLIVAPEGVSSAISKNTSLPIVPSKTLTPVERLEIYANMYFYRILDALKEDFPVLLQSIGEDQFHNLITEGLTLGARKK